MAHWLMSEWVSGFSLERLTKVIIGFCLGKSKLEFELEKFFTHHWTWNCEDPLFFLVEFLWPIDDNVKIQKKVNSHFKHQWSLSKSYFNEKLSGSICLQMQSDLKSSTNMMLPPLNFLALLWHCISKKFLLLQDLKMYIKYLLSCKDWVSRTREFWLASLFWLAVYL